MGKIVRVFPRKTVYTPTDDLARFGPPAALFPDDTIDEVHVSVTFTWDLERARVLAAQWESVYPGKVKLGGPALGGRPAHFEPGMYVRDGITFTSRGCIRRCPWCLVREREGDLREIEIKPGRILNDNNFLACSLDHRARVYDMLEAQRGDRVEFIGGLDSRLFEEYDADRIRDLARRTPPRCCFACDSRAGLKPLRRAVEMLEWLQRRWKRVYVLIGFDSKESTREAEQRIIEVWRSGCTPVALLYQPPTAQRIRYSREWIALRVRWCHMTAVTRSGALVDAGREDLLVDRMRDRQIDVDRQETMVYDGSSASGGAGGDHDEEDDDDDA